MPGQPEMRRGEIRAEHATAHAPDNGVWHLISLICRVSSRPPGPALRNLEIHGDEKTARALEDTVLTQAELFRKYQGFADAIEPPPNATALERALTLSGRDPSWKPASQE